MKIIKNIILLSFLFASHVVCCMDLSKGVVSVGILPFCKNGDKKYFIVGNNPKKQGVSCSEFWYSGFSGGSQAGKSLVSCAIENFCKQAYLEKIFTDRDLSSVKDDIKKNVCGFIVLKTSVNVSKTEHRILYLVDFTAYKDQIFSKEGFVKAFSSLDVRSKQKGKQELAMLEWKEDLYDNETDRMYEADVLSNNTAVFDKLTISLSPAFKALLSCMSWSYAGTDLKLPHVFMGGNTKKMSFLGGCSYTPIEGLSKDEQDSIYKVIMNDLNGGASFPRWVIAVPVVLFAGFCLYLWLKKK